MADYYIYSAHGTNERLTCENKDVIISIDENGYKSVNEKIVYGICNICNERIALQLASIRLVQVNTIIFEKTCLA